MTGNTNSRNRLFRWSVISGFIFLVILTIFSSSLPDGLEWVAHRLGFITREKPVFHAPLADYTLSSGLSPAANQILSAVLGIGIITAVLLIISRLLQSSNKHRSSQ